MKNAELKSLGNIFGKAVLHDALLLVLNSKILFGKARLYKKVLKLIFSSIDQIPFANPLHKV